MKAIELKFGLMTSPNYLRDGKDFVSNGVINHRNLYFHIHYQSLCSQKTCDMSISEVMWHNLAFYRANSLSVSMSEQNAAWISLHQFVTLQSPCHPVIMQWQRTSGALTWESQVSHYFKWQMLEPEWQCYPNSWRQYDLSQPNAVWCM